VIDGRIRKCYLCFTYTRVFVMSFFVLVKANFMSVSEVSNSVNSLSTAYRYAIQNLPTFIKKLGI